MALTTNFTDGSAMATDHAAHHNAMAVKLNNLPPYPLPRISGWYYDGSLASYATGTSSLAANTVMYLPFLVGAAITVDRILIEVTTAGASNVVLGIFNDTGACAPGTVLLDAGVVDPSTTGNKEATVSQALAAGTLYWLAAHNGAVGVTLRGGVGTGMLALGYPTNSVTVARTYYTQALTYTGALATAGTLTAVGGGTGTQPFVKVRVA
jgi:hypothetical protein